MNNLEIKLIESKEDWENFVYNYSPHTFLQSWEWGLSQKVLGQKIYHLGIFNNNKLEGVAFVYKIIAKRGSFLFCPHGPLINKNSPELLAFLVKYLYSLGKKEGVSFLRISPLMKESQETLKIFKKLGFRNAPIHMMHPELAWLIDITIDEENIIGNMKKSTRYSIRKAQKDGVDIKISTDMSDIDSFYSLYQETAKRQFFTPFSLNYVKKEFDIFSKEEKAVLCLAYYNKELVSGAVIVFDNKSGFYHHGASTRKYSNIPAAELVQWEAIRESKRREMNFYNFWGIAQDDNKNHPWHGLSKFKKGFGGFSENYLHAQDLIITQKYWLNFIVEKIRTIKRGY